MNPQQRFIPGNNLFLLIAGMAFYLLNQFSPFINDDYYYSFIAESGIPVTCFKDAVISQIHHYTHWSGRFIIHTIVQYFCGVLGLELFQAINSVIFVILCLGISRIIQKEFGYKNTTNVIFLLLLLLLIPLPGRSFLGNISCSVNYLWSSCFIILFINLYLKHKKDPRARHPAYKTGIFLFATICGSLQESFSIGIAGALFLYYCFHARELKGNLLLLVLGFWIGTCFVVFSPGNFIRHGIKSEVYAGVFIYLKRCSDLLLNAKALDILFLVTIVTLVKKRQQTLLFIRKNILWYLSIIINGAFVIFIAYTAAWQLVSIALFSIILLIKWGYTFCGVFIQRHSKTITNLGIVSLIILYIPIYYYRYTIDREHEKLIQNAKETTNHTVIATKYDSLCTLKNNWFIQNYTRPEIYDVFSKQGISLLLTQGKNKNHITSILPQTQQFIIDHYCKQNQIKENIYEIPGYNFFTICLNDSVPVNQLQIETTKVKTFARELTTKLWKNAKLNTYKRYDIKDLDQFRANGRRYIIIHHSLESPIQNINIISKSY